MKKYKIKAIDLFSGCGGVSCGLTQAGFDVAVAVEINKEAVITYKNYHLLSHVNVIKKDITTLSGENILANGGIKSNELFLLAGCPPCQNFSSQNRNRTEKSKEDKEILLLEFLRIVKECWPPFILMENVPGIRTANNGIILNEFLTKLKNEKSKNITERYIVKSAILNAADYGVPQKRRRFVLHAVRADVYELLLKQNVEFKLPVQTHGKGTAQPWVTVWETISDLPEIAQGEKYEGNPEIKNHQCASLRKINLKRIKKIRASGGSRNGLTTDLVLKCHKKYSGHSDVYGIMSPDKPSPTITGGCLAYSKGRFGHPHQDRAISAREATRLQTFPDDFEFGKSLTKIALQIGNAVPIKLVEASGKEILHCMMSLSRKAKYVSKKKN
jgi:DNA (cytosine-5)-methyltransferase 1